MTVRIVHIRRAAACAVALLVLMAGAQPAKAEFRPLAIGTAPVMPDSQGDAKPARAKPTETEAAPAAPELPSETSDGESYAITPGGNDDATGDGGAFRPLSVGVVPAQKQVRIPQARTPRPERQQQPRQVRRQAPQQQAPRQQRSTGGLGLQPAGVGVPSPLAGPVISAPVANGPILRSETILFNGRSNKLTDTARSQLSALAAALHQSSGAVLELKGFAEDSSMDKNSARALAGRRILEIQSFLRSRDIPSTRLVKNPVGQGGVEQASSGPGHRVDANIRGR